MRKFLILLVAVFALLACATSCKDSALSFEYSFTITGQADGDVSVMFPGGGLDVKGNSELEFSYSSAPADILFSKSTPSYTVQELKSMPGNYAKVAEIAENNYEDQFKAISAGGTYYLHVVGAIYEQLTGIKIEIDKVLTNKEPAEPVYKTE